MRKRSRSSARPPSWLVDGRVPPTPDRRTSRLAGYPSATLVRRCRPHGGLRSGVVHDKRTAPPPRQEGRAGWPPLAEPSDDPALPEPCAPGRPAEHEPTGRQHKRGYVVVFRVTAVCALVGGATRPGWLAFCVCPALVGDQVAHRGSLRDGGAECRVSGPPHLLD